MSEKEVVIDNEGGLALKSLVPDEILQEEDVPVGRSSYNVEEMAGLYDAMEQVQGELHEHELPVDEEGAQRHVTSGHFFTDHSVIMSDAGPQGSIAGVDNSFQSFVAQNESELSVMVLGEEREEEQSEEGGFESDDAIDAIVQSITQTVAGYEAVVVVEEEIAPDPVPDSVVPNVAPVAQNDDFSGNENVAIVGNLLNDNGSGVDADADGGTLSAVAGTFDTDNNGTIVIAADGSFTYTPLADFVGVDSYTYTVEDGQGGSDTATVSFALNDNPVAQDDVFSGNENVAIVGNLLNDNGSGADADSDGGTLSVVAGMFETVNDAAITIAADGSFTYTPLADFAGTDSYTYTVEDGQGGSHTATVSFALNDNPVAQDDAFTSNEGLLITGNVLSDNGSGVDADSDGGTLSVVAGTSETKHGSFTVAEDGSFTYTPDTGYSGVDRAFYTVEDGQGGSDTAMVVFTLNDAADIAGDDGDNFLMGDEEGPAGDVINGDGGNDDIVGGAGADILTGGAGSDKFVYWEVEEGLYDIITDFTRNDVDTDVLELADMLGAYDATTDVLTDFLLVTDDGTDTYVSADVDGGGDNFVLFACLEGITGLTAYTATGIAVEDPDGGPPPAAPVI